MDAIIARSQMGLNHGTESRFCFGLRIKTKRGFWLVFFSFRLRHTAVSECAKIFPAGSSRFMWFQRRFSYHNLRTTSEATSTGEEAAVTLSRGTWWHHCKRQLFLNRNSTWMKLRCFGRKCQCGSIYAKKAKATPGYKVFRGRIKQLV